ncbi:MAG TPA: MFS transporter [Pyrinomonadaceae bacterium]|nr:MFS transporter [Pyrinomonadaceae bacterium]
MATTARPQTQTPQTSRAAGMFRALSHRNFRLFLSGAFLSNTGTWMQSVGQGWLVLQLTNSGAWLGFDNFMATAPGVLLTLVGGVIADKVDRKRLLIYSQLGAGLSAFTLSALLWTDTISWRGNVRRASDVWMILALTFVTGCCWAISGPSYQAITVDLVGREDIANAVALHSSQFQLARVVGPLLAALTIQLFGLPGCFLANGLSYVAIVFALSLVKFHRPGAAKMSVKGNEADGAKPAGDLEGDVAAGLKAGEALGAAAVTQAESAGAGRSMWAEFAEGIRYVRGRPRVRVILLCSTIVCLFGTPYMVLMPMFAKNVYGWDERGLSLLMGTAGAGALTGALALAYMGDFRRKGLFLLGTLSGGGSCIVAFASVPRAWMALPLLFCTGFSMVCFFALGSTLLQQLVRDEMRGRVMSMWLLTFIGTMPVASVLAGASADRFGPRPTLAACGAVILLFALAVASRNPNLREI